MSINNSIEIFKENLEKYKITNDKNQIKPVIELIMNSYDVISKYLEQNNTDKLSEQNQLLFKIFSTFLRDKKKQFQKVLNTKLGNKFTDIFTKTDLQLIEQIYKELNKKYFPQEKIPESSIAIFKSDIDINLIKKSIPGEKLLYFNVAESPNTNIDKQFLKLYDIEEKPSDIRISIEVPSSKIELLQENIYQQNFSNYVLRCLYHMQQQLLYKLYTIKYINTKSLYIKIIYSIPCIIDDNKFIKVKSEISELIQNNIELYKLLDDTEYTINDNKLSTKINIDSDWKFIDVSDLNIMIPKDIKLNYNFFFNKCMENKILSESDITKDTLNKLSNFGLYIYNV